MKSKKEEKVWFRAKIYGYGWYPSSWQGFLVLFIWAVLFFVSIVKINDHEWLKNILFIFLITFVLLWICYVKGEKLGWRWGKSITKV